MAGTPRSLTAPSPSAGTCVRVAITRAAAESTSVFLGQTLAPQGQGDWLGWCTHQQEQTDPSYLAVAVETVFVEVLAAGLQQCHSVHVRVCACVRVTTMCVVSDQLVVHHLFRLT